MDYKQFANTLTTPYRQLANMNPLFIRRFITLIIYIPTLILVILMMAIIQIIELFQEAPKQIYENYKCLNRIIRNV